ncbi:unnamed protein product [Dibothriocephalus latus]|uniref:Uncharacterized protein n=1 Tax=Dibothriocephalus latus TaxID=60516 RepID=A0A3P6TZB7_DIBLA|nr:unnamed protein product [Dibothriocephalus latus]
MSFSTVEGTPPMKDWAAAILVSNYFLDITSPNASRFLPTDQLPNSGDAECCYPLKEEGYRSLLSSASGGLLSFPVAYMLVILFGRRWSISVSFAAVAILLFVEFTLLFEVSAFERRRVAGINRKATK